MNGNTSTFGVELEFVGGNADAIASELYDLGITAAPYRLGYHARISDDTKWKLERDGVKVNQSCGGHSHIVMNKLDIARQRWRRFFKMVESYKECLYRAADGNLGRIRSNASSLA